MSGGAAARARDGCERFEVEKQISPLHCSQRRAQVRSKCRKFSVVRKNPRGPSGSKEGRFSRGKNQCNSRSLRDDNKGTNNNKSEGAALGGAKVEVEKQISPLRRSR